MIEMKRDLFSFIGEADAICITTNGCVRHDGTAVMGRGCARTFADTIMPSAPATLGSAIRTKGNHVHKLGKIGKTNFFSFPVKPANGYYHNIHPLKIVPHMRNKIKLPGVVPGWAHVADAAIIRSSASSIRYIADKYGLPMVVLPRPGCGNGHLDWYKTVKPILANYLGDDRFIIVHF